MKRTMTVAMAFLVALMIAMPVVSAEGPDEKERAELSKAIKDAKVPLQRGLSASKKEGTPISGKYEVEHGKLQLSVYTMKGDKFSEVIVDHKTGKVAKSDAITQGDDLTAAKKQGEAMGKTKVALADAVAKAEKANAGFKAVAIEPELEAGATQADVSLLKGAEAKQ